MKNKKGKTRIILTRILGAFLAVSSVATLAACNDDTKKDDNIPPVVDPDDGEDETPVIPEPETYTITFAGEDGTIYGTQEVKEGTKATLPTYVDSNGNAITKWYYEYESGVTEIWSFAGYVVTEDMTLYAVENSETEVSGPVYELDASLNAYINAMGGVEFGNGLLKSATLTVLSESENRYLLSLEVGKSSVTIYGITCDTFIDPAATSTTADSSLSPVPLGSIGYYDANGNIVTDGVTYTLSAEDDTCSAPDPEGGTNYTPVRYVTEINMVLENVGSLADLSSLNVTFYINSQVMGGQFVNDGPSTSMKAATLEIKGMTEIEQPEETPVSGISSAVIDENGHLILTLSDGSTLDAGLVKGEDGNDGVGISNIHLADSILYIYMTDGTVYEFDLGIEGGSSLPANVSETKATCIEDGVRTTYTDASHSEVLGVRTIEKATGHTYENGKCSVCGAEQIDDMTFTLNEEGTGYILSSFNSHAWDTIVIPDTYNDLPVVGIADGETLYGVSLQSSVFMNHIEIESVTLGANLVSVGIGAFYGCSNLSSINLNNVTTIGTMAFQNAGLKEVVLSADLTAIPNNAFYGNTNLESITLGNKITSIGNSAFYNCQSLKNINIPSSVESIGNSCFMNAGLTSIIIPDSVTSLGTSAFSDCINLVSASVPTSITLPNSLFIRCSSLKTFNSSEEGVCDLSAYNSIPNSAFLDSEFTKIILSNNLTSIGSSAFSNNDSLVEIDFNNNLQDISFGSQTFQNCTSLTNITLPTNVTELASTMFSGCSSLESIVLPEGITAIPSNFLEDCVSLTSIKIPSSVTELASNALNGCTSLTSVNFAEDSALTTLRGISGCTSLRSLTIPQGVTSISSCSGNTSLIEIINLSNLTITAGNTDNGSIALYAEVVTKTKPNSSYVTVDNYTLYNNGENVWVVTAYNGEIEGKLELPANFVVNETTISSYSIAGNVFNGNLNITSLVIPASVTSIGARAFSDCTNLESVTFAENSSLTTIGNGAFSGCEVLSSINLPSSVKTIKEDAFSNCESLNNINLGSVETIEAGVFSNCYALKVVTLPSTLTSLASDAFSGASLAEVYNLTSLETLPEASNIYNAEGNSKLITTSDGYTFLYLLETEKAYLVSYNKDGGMITLPESFMVGDKTISNYEIYPGAFAGKSFTSITIPASVTGIGAYAFYNVDVLRIAFNDPSTCLSIGEYAFAYSNVMMFNASMTESYILNLEGLTSIGEYAFAYTTRLKTLEFGTTLTNIGSRAFAYSAIDKINFVESREESITLASYAFAYMTSLTDITLPSYIQELPERIFQGCSKLTSVTLPNTLTTINRYVFRDCTSLIELILPSSLTSVNSSAMGNSSIEKYYLNGTEEDFAEVSLPTSIKNKAYYYSEEDPINDGNYWHYEGKDLVIWPMVV